MREGRGDLLGPFRGAVPFDAVENSDSDIPSSHFAKSPLLQTRLKTIARNTATKNAGLAKSRSSVLHSSREASASLLPSPRRGAASTFSALSRPALLVSLLS